ncbi:MAG: hypothetical protein AAF798_19945 [Bacteroidota bacterium]
MLPTTPVVTLDQVGQTEISKLSYPDTGDCCYTEINVEFYTTPEFICPADTVVACNASTDPLVLGEPIITSCIPGGGVVSFEDAIQDNGDCGDPRVVITRTWMVADNQGNAATCVQMIEIDAFDLDQVHFPANFDNLTLPALNCAAVLADPSLTHPDSTGYPTIDGTDLFEVNYCQSSYSFTDERFDICPGSYEILRTWKVRNTCLPVEAGVNPREFVQVIQVLDPDGPQLDCPAPINVSTGPFNCTAALIVPIPTIVDACSEATFTVNASAGALTLQNGVYFLSNLPIGTHAITYTATDECRRSSSCSVEVTVVDEVAPVAVCNDELNIAIGGAGFARIEASAVDGGSYDNCGPVRVEVRRLVEYDLETCDSLDIFFTEWADAIEFSCCDVNQLVRIELRVWDDANRDGVIGGPDDQSNVCWMEVLIEDKLLPICEAPPNTVIACDTVPYDFDPTDIEQLQALFGEASAADNCTADWEELTPIDQLNDCGVGQLIRRFRAVDTFGNSSTNTCQQRVLFQAVHNYEIKFPKDATANCSVPTADTIEYRELGCDLLAVSVEDLEFAASGEECYNIFRRYQVINWCEYDGEADPVIVGRDEDCDGVPGDEDIWVLVRPNGAVYFDRDQDENNQNPSAFLKLEACDGLTNPTGHWLSTFIDQSSTPPRTISSNGFWQYTQTIKVYDNIDPEISFESPDPFCSLDNVDCDGEVNIAFQVEESCTPDDLTLRLSADYFGDGLPDTVLVTSDAISGSYPNYTISGVFPLGAHAFFLAIEDGCGNSNLATIPFEVVDCKAPSPICKSGLSIEIMPVSPAADVDGYGDLDEGAATIWAADFIASPVEDCNAPVSYSVNRLGEMPNQSQTSLVLTCEDVGNVILEIYAWDSANNPYALQPDSTLGGPNYAFCESFIIVQDNMFEVCGEASGMGSLAGLIHTEENEGIENVTVTISGAMNDAYNTGIDGSYEFAGVAAGGDYTVTPLLDLDPDNGVSTFDLILVTKHILNVLPLDSPYKRIAADVDRSGSITVADLIQMRKIILTVDDAFPNNTSWRFVDAAYEFPDPTNPWLEEFPEVISVNNLVIDQLYNGDFIGVKIGDVSADAIANTLVAIEDRRLDRIDFEVADRWLSKGEVVEVAITTEQLSQFEGFQLSLNADLEQIELLGVTPNVVQPKHLNTLLLEDGIVAVSWDAANQVDDEGEAPTTLLSLRIKALNAIRLSEVLSIADRPVFTEAYHRDGRLFDLGLRFTDRPSTSGYQLLQNQPNPFEQRTIIPFVLPEAMDAVLLITTIDGKLIRKIEDHFKAGLNEIVFDWQAHDQVSGGVLIYTLKAKDFTASKRMIILH